MPDIIKISELDEALALADAAEFPYYQDNAGQNTTYKAPMTQIGAKIVEGLTYQGINLPAGAGNKTVENSLNYLLNAIGGDPNGNISDYYDPTAAYVKGDLCIYDNVLYICTAPTTGTFDPSKWTATTIDNVIGDLSTLTTTDKSSIVGAVNEINNSLTNYSTSTVTDIFATYQGTMISDVIVTQTHKVTSMVLRGTIPAGSWQSVGTVKDRFKNSVYNQFFAVIDTTATYIGMMYLGTDGTVNFFLHGTGNKNVDFGFTYIAQ